MIFFIKVLFYMINFKFKLLFCICLIPQFEIMNLIFNILKFWMAQNEKIVMTYSSVQIYGILLWEVYTDIHIK